RINVFPITVPPLRERMTDLLPLVDYFIDKLNRKLELAVRGMDDAVIELLMRHSWPGNIRELENLMERMMLVAKTPVITVGEVPPEFQANLQENVIPLSVGDKASFKDFIRKHMENVEKQMIIKCLEESGDNVTRAAKQLGISRKGLQLKMIKFNLRK
ncbi:MAG: helix-turn-helix domain-containing protein, partial [Smithellaceae bacterium]|nr:helix-turn-helix domain-containing protein [Smithellaceae bacterium]